MTSFISAIFLFFFILKLSVVLYLSYRNQKNILKNRLTVPSLFDDIISLADHQKAAAYSITKIKVGYFFTFFDFFIIYLWTLGGGFNSINQFTSTFALSEIMQGTLFFVLIILLTILLNLPESIYSTFVVEEKYGFNKTTPKTFIMDLLKSLLLTFLIGIPVIICILYFVTLANNLWWLFTWILLTFVKLFMILIYPQWIAPLFNKFTPLDSSDLLEKIKDLLARVGFHAEKVMVMDASKRSKHGNAYFTGFGKNKRVVFFDTLLEKLTHQEVLSILAHELGHYKKKHIIKIILLDIVFTFLGLLILGNLFNEPLFYNGHGVDEIRPWLGLILFVTLTPIYTFLITPLMSYLSRRHEFEADDFSIKYASKEDMISALKKLYRDNSSTLTPDPIYSAFYYSHPPALERVIHLKGET